VLSSESYRAVKNIQSILKDSGVVDIFSQYPTKDIAFSVLALSRLQRIQNSADNSPKATADKRNSHEDLDTTTVAEAYNSATSLINSDNIDDIVDKKLIHDLAYYAIFANAAYSWTLGLLPGRFHWGKFAALSRKTGVLRHNIIAANWKAETYLPAFFLVRDVKRQKLILSIRGTLSVEDILTDLCCTAEDVSTLTQDSAEESKTCESRAHRGMVAAALGVSKGVGDLIASELASNPHYNLIIVGHSLGGGIAAVLGTLWQDVFPGLVVYSYGCPCVGPLNVQPTTNKSIVSVVGEGDPFSCLSLGHLLDISSALSVLCEDHDLRNDILTRTQSENISDKDMQWLMEKMEALQMTMTAEKHYPAGRILYMRGNLFGRNECVTLKVVPQSTFKYLNLHHRMFDLSRHIPHRYEGVLRRLISNTRRNNCK